MWIPRYIVHNLHNPPRGDTYTLSVPILTQFCYFFSKHLGSTVNSRAWLAQFLEQRQGRAVSHDGRAMVINANQEWSQSGEPPDLVVRRALLLYDPGRGMLR